MQDTFALALDARAHWAGFKIAVVAGEGVQTAASKSQAEMANAAARQLGFACFPDTTMPNLIADVPELIQQWSDGFAEAADAQTHYAVFLQQWANDRSEAKEDAEQMRAEAGEDAEIDGSSGTEQSANEEPPITAATFRVVHARIAEMAEEANSRCGLSYEYMVSLLCPMVEGLLTQYPEEQRPGIAMVARMFGYVSPDELERGQQEMADEGYCRHGLDYWTCPCGCFEN